MMLLQWVVASWRRHLLAQEVERLQLIHERDQAALRSQQSELRVLQAQIQPHFIFNTLAALQHWVDIGDPRAGPLLQTLTGFLRAGTELIGHERATLHDEARMAGQYLTILQQRLGDRLAWRDEIPAGLRTHALPSGLLMTLVENAVEHGVEASLRPVTVVLGGECGSQGGDGRLRLWVEDDGPGWPSGCEPTDGVGLSNARSRLQHAFGPGARLQLQARPGGGCRAAVEWNDAALPRVLPATAVTSVTGSSGEPQA
jgi:LytS/YehU family sensor histidine kinase